MADETGDDFLRVFVEEASSPGLAEGVREMFPHAVDVIVAHPALADGTPVRAPRPAGGCVIHESSSAATWKSGK